MSRSVKAISVASFVVGAVIASLPAAAQNAEPRSAASVGQAQAAAAGPFATVNGKPISQAEFQMAYDNHLRQKFYHGQVPQEQLAQARKNVTDQLVERILFLEEIEKRGIKPDSEEVEQRLRGYDQRYANNPNWQKNREIMLPALREQLDQQSTVARLEKQVRTLPPPTAEEVKAYYAAKPELFTEPEKLRLHSILLAVDPSSARAVWEAALREGEVIVRRIRGGADFSEQARLVSRDASAEKGGDMGYLHQGMLPESLQAKLGEFKLGEVGDPIELLQGVGIFRLDERVPARLVAFETVADRAKSLLQRDQQEQVWSDLVAKLRKAAVVVIHEPLAGQAPAKN